MARKQMFEIIMFIKKNRKQTNTVELNTNNAGTYSYKQK